MSSKGVLFFATCNDNVNYLKIALANALMCKKNLNGIPVSVVTSTDSLNKNKDLSDLITSTFDQIIIDDKTTGTSNIRRYSDTQYASVKDRFINTNRGDAYNLSPYDETLLMDVDYLVQDSSLNAVWGSVEDFLINDVATDAYHNKLLDGEFRLNPTGIKMVWATVIYFKKTERAKLIFDTVSFIKENWEYYRSLYCFNGGLFRNDFAFSIALHILNGYLENDEYKKLPVPFILTSTDRDDIYDVGENWIIVMYNDWNMRFNNHPHAFYLSKVDTHNIHIMNKISLARHCDKLIEVYSK